MMTLLDHQTKAESPHPREHGRRWRLWAALAGVGGCVLSGAAGGALVLAVHGGRPAPATTGHQPAPPGDWLARQICKYAQLAAGDDDRYPWILKGQVAGRGPDHEPLIVQPEPLAVLSAALIEQAQRHYHACFEVGRDSLS